VVEGLLWQITGLLLAGTNFASCYWLGGRGKRRGGKRGEVEAWSPAGNEDFSFHPQNVELECRDWGLRCSVALSLFLPLSFSLSFPPLGLNVQHRNCSGRYEPLTFPDFTSM